jgi:hypothetical protein
MYIEQRVAELENYNKELISTLELLTKRYEELSNLIQNKNDNEQFTAWPLKDVSDSPVGIDAFDVVPDVVIDKAPTKITHDQLKALLVETSKGDTSAKPRLKALLKSYNANTVKDLSEQDTENVFKKVKKGVY